MQPYYFPYLGYWQLFNYVDVFVFYDDVQFMKGGWVNRNKILINGKVDYITIPLKKASHKTNINEREFVSGFNFAQHKSLILLAYKDSPQIAQINLLIESIANKNSPNLSDFLYDTIVAVADLINSQTKIIKSSDLLIDQNLRGQERVLEICKKLNANEYINLIGGKELYNKISFNEEGIELRFLQKKSIVYPQCNNYPFVDNLSILDLLAYNSIVNVKNLLNEYEVF
jgi:hypothetical protein